MGSDRVIKAYPAIIIDLAVTMFCFTLVRQRFASAHIARIQPAYHSPPTTGIANTFY